MSTRRVPVDGYCDSRFAIVREQFERNFYTEGQDNCDLGASFSVVINGKTLIDLWGGHTDLGRNIAWKGETIVCVFSITKAIASLCLHLLHARKFIDIDKPIANYWPEFRAAGKEAITVRMLLSHQAGLLYTDEVTEGSLWGDTSLGHVLVNKVPEWSPGADGGYHSFTFGPIADQIVRRTTGQTTGQFVRKELAPLLGIQFGIGLTEIEMSNCSPFYVDESNATIRSFRELRNSSVYRCWKALPRDESFNSENWRRLEFASLNGHSNARSLAKIFSLLANRGNLEGSDIFSPGYFEDFSRVHWSGTDRFSEEPGAFNAGFQASNSTAPLGGRAGNFGFYGIGGSVAFCDPEVGLSFGYCCNRCTPGASAQNPLSLRLIKATYDALKSH